MNSGKVVIETELDTKKFDAQIEEVKRNLEDIETILSDTKGMDADEISKYNAEAEKLRNRLADLVKKRDELNNPPSQLLEWSKDFGRSLKDSVTRIGRLIIGIFGIRTAYNAVRNAMSIITANDEQLKADIDYMKNVLAYMLEPVVRTIVGWFKQLMFYVGYIAKAWFGVDIYAKASEKAMNAMANSSKKTAKNAKEIHKQLAGFDEMNILQDTSGGGTDTGGGVTMPSFDLSKTEDINVPKWMEWLLKNGPELIYILSGITAGLLALKLGFDPLTSLGIGVTVAGIVKMAKEIYDYIKKPDWENFGGIVEGIGIAILGLGIATGNLPAIIAGAAILIVGIVLKYWGQIESFLDEKIKWLKDSITSVRDFFGDTIGDIYEIAVYAVGLLWNSIKQFVRGVRETFDGIIFVIKGIFTKNWNTALDGLTKAFSGFTKTIGALWDILWGNLKKVASKIGTTIGENMVGTIKSAINGVLWLIEERINGAIQLINGAIGLINKIPGVNIGRIGNVYLPRLAKGGIVNNPGQGVMMGSYIAGERGAEAVLPLTDDTLQRLANMIPITVNLTNTMNGRVISRELQKVQNENNFAFNR